MDVHEDVFARVRKFSDMALGIGRVINHNFGHLCPRKSPGTTKVIQKVKNVCANSQHTCFLPIIGLWCLM